MNKLNIDSVPTTHFTINPKSLRLNKPLTGLNKNLGEKKSRGFSISSSSLFSVPISFSKLISSDSQIRGIVKLMQQLVRETRTTELGSFLKNWILAIGDWQVLRTLPAPLSIIFALSITTSAFAQSDLDNYLQFAYEHNPSLQASYKNLEVALQRIPQVKVLPNPQVSFGFFISPVETRLGPQQARVSLSQMFPWFGTLAAKGDVATLQADALYQDFLADKTRLGYEVKLVYYPLYEVKQQIRWQEENLSILESYKALATTSFSSGKGSLTDALRVDIMMERAEVEIQLLKDKIKPLEIAFNRKLNRADSLSVEISDSFSTESLELDYRKDSLSQNPRLMALETRVQATKAMEEVAKKNAMPSFGIGLDYALVGKRTDANPTNNGRDILMPMVTLSLPIAQSKYKAAIQEQKLRQMALQSAKQATENDLFAMYQMAKYELDKAIAMSQLYDRQTEKTEQVIELLQTAYSNSGKDFRDILEMQQQLLQYKMAKASAVKQYYLALAQLDYLTSKID